MRSSSAPARNTMPESSGAGDSVTRPGLPECRSMPSTLTGFRMVCCFIAGAKVSNADAIAGTVCQRLVSKGVPDSGPGGDLPGRWRRRHGIPRGVSRKRDTAQGTRRDVDSHEVAEPRLEDREDGGPGGLGAEDPPPAGHRPT